MIYFQLESLAHPLFGCVNAYRRTSVNYLQQISLVHRRNGARETVFFTDRFGYILRAKVWPPSYSNCLTLEFRVAADWTNSIDLKNLDLELEYKSVKPDGIDSAYNATNHANSISPEYLTNALHSLFFCRCNLRASGIKSSSAYGN